MSFGIKTTSAENNGIVEQILRGLSKTSSFFDDVKLKISCTRRIQRRMPKKSNCLPLETPYEYDQYLNQKKLHQVIQKNTIDR